MNNNGPSSFYLVKQPDGTVKWYSRNPSVSENRGEALDGVEDFLFQRFGVGTFRRPLRLEISGTLTAPTAPFNARTAMDVISGKSEKTVMDDEGHRVAIMGIRSTDPEYPYNGIVLDNEGAAVVSRSYSGLGICSDGVPSHNLFVIGPAEEENPSE